MKRFTFAISMLLVSVFSFSQEKITYTGNKPIKFASWTISEPFHAASMGPYLRPTFNVAIDREGYYCVVNLFSETGYYSVDAGTLPHLYLKTKDGEIIDLEMDGDEPVHKFQIDGYFVLNVWIPKRYVTRLIYYIPNAEEFFSCYYTKYRIWLGEGFRDIEFSNGYAKKFNMRLKNAREEALSKYNTKQNSLDDPLHGF